MHVHPWLEAPQGPLAGRHGARFSMVLTKEPGGWEIVAFHDTLETGRGRPGYEVAVVPPAARALLELFDARSAHFEVRQPRARPDEGG